eukprot:38790_1
MECLQLRAAFGIQSLLAERPKTALLPRASRHLYQNGDLAGNGLDRDPGRSGHARGRCRADGHANLREMAGHRMVAPEARLQEVRLQDVLRLELHLTTISSKRSCARSSHDVPGVRVVRLHTECVIYTTVSRADSTQSARKGKIASTNTLPAQRRYEGIRHSTRMLVRVWSQMPNGAHVTASELARLIGVTRLIVTTTTSRITVTTSRITVTTSQITVTTSRITVTTSRITVTSNNGDHQLNNGVNPPTDPDHQSTQGDHQSSDGDQPISHRSSSVHDDSQVNGWQAVDEDFVERASKRARTNGVAVKQQNAGEESDGQQRFRPRSSSSVEPGPEFKPLDGETELANGEYLLDQVPDVCTSSECEQLRTERDTAVDKYKSCKTRLREHAAALKVYEQNVQKHARSMKKALMKCVTETQTLKAKVKELEEQLSKRNSEELTVFMQLVLDTHEESSQRWQAVFEKYQSNEEND